MDEERDVEFLNDLVGRFPDDVITRCMIMYMNGTLEEVVEAVESLYEHGVPRNVLYYRRQWAWNLYLNLLNSMILIPNLGQHRMAFRACLLVFITRIALEHQHPMTLAEWYRIGNAGDPDDRTPHIGNLWSSNFLDRNYEMDDDEKCPHRDHNISLQPPYHGFDDLERGELRDGRLMIILPLDAREKSGQCRWRGRYPEVRNGLCHRIIHEDMEIYDIRNDCSGRRWGKIDAPSEDFFSDMDRSLLVPKLQNINRVRRDRWTHPFECLICGMRFHYMSMLTRHHRTHLHNGKWKKPFECSVCKKTFLWKWNFDVHMLMHARAKPYVCTICGFSTTHKTNLSNHFIKHTGRKQFECSKCTFCTSWKSSLKRHVEIYHPICDDEKSNI